jgi:hypothetical protein
MLRSLSLGPDKADLDGAGCATELVPQISNGARAGLAAPSIRKMAILRYSGFRERQDENDAYPKC